MYTVSLIITPIIAIDGIMSDKKHNKYVEYVLTCISTHIAIDLVVTIHIALSSSVETTI